MEGYGVKSEGERKVAYIFHGLMAFGMDISFGWVVGLGRFPDTHLYMGERMDGLLDTYWS